MLVNSIDKSWTLFLDRDGVINKEKHQEYVNTWDEFYFYAGVTEAIKIFSLVFGRIFIVTNQRGVAKGLTTPQNLEFIHRNMLATILLAEGKIDKIYFCTDMEDTSYYRKPNPGMGLQAKKDFPEVEFSKSIMIGNTLSDMQFGRNLGLAYTIFLTTTSVNIQTPHPLIDAIFTDLHSVALAL